MPYVDGATQLLYRKRVVRIVFLRNELGPGCEKDASNGAALMDVCDECRAPILFSCRSASCGTCRVEVLEGQALLLPPSADELEVLDLFDATPSQRLACRARVGNDDGLLRLRWVGDT